MDLSSQKHQALTQRVSLKITQACQLIDSIKNKQYKDLVLQDYQYCQSYGMIEYILRNKRLICKQSPKLNQIEIYEIMIAKWTGFDKDRKVEYYPKLQNNLSRQHSFKRLFKQAIKKFRWSKHQNKCEEQIIQENRTQMTKNELPIQSNYVKHQKQGLINPQIKQIQNTADRCQQMFQKFQTNFLQKCLQQRKSYTNQQQQDRHQQSQHIHKNHLLTQHQNNNEVYHDSHTNYYTQEQSEQKIYINKSYHLDQVSNNYLPADNHIYSELDNDFSLNSDILQCTQNTSNNYTISLNTQQILIVLPTSKSYPQSHTDQVLNLQSIRNTSNICLDQNADSELQVEYQSSIFQLDQSADQYEQIIKKSQKILHQYEVQNAYDQKLQQRYQQNSESSQQCVSPKNMKNDD